MESIYRNLVMEGKYDCDGAARHRRRLKNCNVKAKEMPAREAEYVLHNRRGDSLQYAMALFKMLRDANIEAYIALVVVDRHRKQPKMNDHFGVCYIDAKGKVYIADPIATIMKKGEIEHHRIPIEEYARRKGKIRMYDPYGVYGEKLFFESFLENPKGIYKLE